MTVLCRYREGQIAITFVCFITKSLLVNSKSGFFNRISGFFNMKSGIFH